MIVAPTTPMSLEEYLSYDDGTDKRYELIDGRLVEMGAESTLNIQIANFLFACFLRLGVPHYLITSNTILVLQSYG